MVRRILLQGREKHVHKQSSKRGHSEFWVPQVIHLATVKEVYQVRVGGEGRGAGRIQLMKVLEGCPNCEKAQTKYKK